MIIKSLRINQGSKYRIKQLVSYILQDGNVYQNPFETFIILNNIHTADISKIHKEFLANDKYRKQRKRGVCYYHDIISASPKDTAKITLPMLEDLAKKHIEIRGAKEALVLVKCHFEKDHLHIHFLISGTKYKSSESLRLDNKAFAKVRTDFEKYQQARYPELESIAYLNKERLRFNKEQSDKRTRRQNEYQMKARLKGKVPTKKEILKERINAILETSKSSRKFLSRIKNEPDFELYEYRNKITGLVFQGVKYRFTTIGISTKELQQLREQYFRLQQIPKDSLEQDLGRGI